jgi:acyl-CoA thioesterase YciA
MSAPDAPAAPRGEISLRVMAMPKDTNSYGKIFGGWVMGQMDMAGAMHAYAETNMRLATVAVEGMKFHKPINVGDEVTCYTRVGRIGRTSIAIDVETWVRSPRHTQAVHVTSGTYIYVALDDDGRPAEITKRNA